MRAPEQEPIKTHEHFWIVERSTRNSPNTKKIYSKQECLQSSNKNIATSSGVCGVGGVGGGVEGKVVGGNVCGGGG